MNRIGNIGLLLIGTALCVLAVSKLNHPYKIEPDYQILQLGELARNQFLIDKNNGRIWQRVCSGESKGIECDGMITWEEMYVSGLTPEDSTLGKVYHYVTQAQLAKADRKGKEQSQ